MESIVNRNFEDTKKELIEEINRRVEDKAIEATNADLLIKLINNSDNSNEAIMIAQLGTAYKRTGFHYDIRFEKISNDIRYLKKLEDLSFDNGGIHHKLIIGDNYEALQQLLIGYKEKINIIYIDPPYGKDNMGEFAKTNYNNAITRDNLLSMLNPRLKLAKRLLNDDGIIFVSIDDRNQAYIKCLMDEIFGEVNFITTFPKKGIGGRQDSEYYAVVHEYILCYAKNRANFEAGEKYKYRSEKEYPYHDDKGDYKTQLLRKWGDNSHRENRPNLFYPIYYSKETDTVSVHKCNDKDIELYPMLSASEEGCWRWGPDTMEQNIADGYVEVKKQGNAYIPYEKLYLDEADNTTVYNTWIDDVDASTGSKLLKTVLGDKLFDYPKPTDLIIKLINMATTNKDSIILDFFAGSGTTGHAVLEQNAIDSGNRTYIMVQLDESLDETSSNATVKRQIKLINKLGLPKNLASITYERLSRIMTGYSYKHKDDGFKWVKQNIPYGGSLDVYEIASVASFESTEGKTPFDVIDETCYGNEKMNTIEKIKWVCENFENAQKYLESDQEYLKRISEN